jgi:lysozyme family protein
VTETEILDAIIEREGDYSDHSADRGGATRWGITARVLGQWRKLGRQATREEVKSLTPAEARAIYAKTYVQGPGFTADVIPYEPLRCQVIDHGVLSGPGTAKKDLQKALGVTVDGFIGPATREAIRQADLPRVHVELVKIRTMRLVRIAQKDPSQLVFLAGWVTRSLNFL